MEIWFFYGLIWWAWFEFKPIFMSPTHLDETYKTPYIGLLSNLIRACLGVTMDRSIITFSYNHSK